MHSEGSKSFLTNGEWEVSEIVGYNEEELTVFVLCIMSSMFIAFTTSSVTALSNTIGPGPIM